MRHVYSCLVFTALVSFILTGCAEDEPQVSEVNVIISEMAWENGEAPGDFTIDEPGIAEELLELFRNAEYEGMFDYVMEGQGVIFDDNAYRYEIRSSWADGAEGIVSVQALSEDEDGGTYHLEGEEADRFREIFREFSDVSVANN